MLDREISDQIMDHLRHRFYGKYRGTVTENDDPTHRGRLEVVVPAVTGEQKVWAMPCVPYAGKGVGSYALPEKKAGVWVEFEGGDPSYAIWTGFFWADEELPKDENGKEVNPSVKISRSQEGLMLALHDDNQRIVLSDKNGHNFIQIDVRGEKITVQAKQKVVVQAPLIELVESASHPLVFGDDLLQYLNNLVALFNAHLHTGELALGVFPVTPAPPVSPFPSAQLSMLSTKVKTG
jgi:uncharacterized protein involved in type VI secretion and phage assembly